MAELTVRASCANHPDKLAVATCDNCDKPLCSTCRVQSVAANEDFCSDECAEEHGVATHEQLLPGYDHPFRTGWKLWARSLGTLIRYTAPLALLMIIFFALGTVAGGGGFTVVLKLALGFTLLFGIALTSTVLAQQYTGLVRGNPYVWTLQRIAPWVSAWMLMIVATFLGSLVLIVPGIIAGLRLFWADEFALTHRLGPIESLKESWRVTRGEAREVFVFQFLSGLAMSLIVFLGGFTFGVLTFALEALASQGIVLDVISLGIVVILIFLGYGAIHAPEMAKFYGMYAVKTLGRTGQESLRRQPEEPLPLAVAEYMPLAAEQHSVLRGVAALFGTFMLGAFTYSVLLVSNAGFVPELVRGPTALIIMTILSAGLGIMFWWSYVSSKNVLTWLDILGAGVLGTLAVTTLVFTATATAEASRITGAATGAMVGLLFGPLIAGAAALIFYTFKGPTSDPPRVAPWDVNLILLGYLVYGLYVWIAYLFWTMQGSA